MLMVAGKIMSPANLLKFSSKLSYIHNYRTDKQITNYLNRYLFTFENKFIL